MPVKKQPLIANENMLQQMLSQYLLTGPAVINEWSAADALRGDKQSDISSEQSLSSILHPKI